MTPYDPEVTIVTNNASIPSDDYYVNTTFFIIGNITNSYDSRISWKS
ncbi:MPPV-162 hypothetical protein [Magpiepox virus 2]|nr:MPPV-162 hypothetical protein [Magpiepox virus 2]